VDLASSLANEQEGGCHDVIFFKYALRAGSSTMAPLGSVLLPPFVNEPPLSPEPFFYDLSVPKPQTPSLHNGQAIERFIFHD
jgi:hypothetical protein